MNIIYAGVTPRVLFDTYDLQDTEKLSKQGNKFVKNRDGVCLSMVLDWIQKCSQLQVGVTKKSELKSGLSLALMQSSFMLGTYDETDTTESFIDNQGLSINTATTLKKKTFSFQKTRYQKIAVALGGLMGFAYISIQGNGGHALGYWHRAGSVQFFDPNEGIMQFNSSADFTRWFPSYIVNEYPNLLKVIILRKIQV